ncbi:MAG: N-acetyltransferase, partial [Comamonadaceae bacterium]
MPAVNPPLEIRAFDPQTASRAEWAAYQVYRRLRAAEDAPDVPLLDDAEFEHFIRRQEPLTDTRRLLALRGDEIVGNLVLWLRREGTAGYEDYAPYLDAGGGVAR